MPEEGGPSIRVVKMTWNQRLNAEANYSLQTEIILDGDADPEQAGKDAMRFIDSFQAGMLGYANGDVG